jgi:plastocyanin
MVRTRIGGGVLALLLVSCGGQETGTSGSATPAEPAPQMPADCVDVRRQGTVEVVSRDNEYAPECLLMSPDQEIRVVNEDLVVHSFTITAEPPDEEPPLRTPFLLDIHEIEGGKKATTDPIGDVIPPGEAHPYFCIFHAGMEGQIWVAAE